MTIFIECLRSQRLLVKRMLELKMAVTPTSVRCSDSHLCCPISNISTTPTALLCISSSTSSTTTSQPLLLHCSVLVVVLHLVVLVVLLHLNHSHCTALYYISNTFTLCTTQPTTVHIIKQHRTTFQEHKFPVCSSEKHFNIAQQCLTPSLCTGVGWTISL